MEKFTVIEAKPFCLNDNLGFEILDKAGISYVDIRGKDLDGPEVSDAFKRATTLLCGNQLTLDAKTLDERFPNLKVIGKVGTGLDNVDIPAATKRGIIVCNTPGANSQAVADLTLGLMLAVCRKIPTGYQVANAGKVLEDYDFFGIDVWGKTLGLLGMGAIGKNVALRAKGFNMDIIAYDPYWPAEFAAEHGIEKAGDMATVLKKADFVSLHLPHTPETENMINKDTIAQMKTGAIVINTSRGSLINDNDLADAIKAKKLAGAGLDAHRVEPLPPDYPMFNMDNVVLMPHVGGFTYGAISLMSVWAAEQIVGFYEGITPKFIVNPEVVS